MLINLNDALARCFGGGFSVFWVIVYGMVCVRCGIVEDSIRMQKRKDRKIELLCRSCVLKPAKTVQTAFGRCIPWKGDFTAQDEPLNKDGSKFLPGVRACKNRDCVNREHLV